MATEGDHESFDENHSAAKAKTHECSICRAEFAIGQALGGHMRHHRTHVPRLCLVFKEVLCRLRLHQFRPQPSGILQAFVLLSYAFWLIIFSRCSHVVED
ncbi:hypothetical protein Droror1_Dr00018009 [Drosera rotundifolia]